VDDKDVSTKVHKSMFDHGIIDDDEATWTQRGVPGKKGVDPSPSS
jgi:hypothetical protein